MKQILYLTLYSTIKGKGFDTAADAGKACFHNNLIDFHELL